jgi:predicted RNase H-like HicB family nuclease
MEMAHFFGIMDCGGKSWGVRVPDLPGCHGAGPTPGKALADAIGRAGMG